MTRIRMSVWVLVVLALLSSNTVTAASPDIIGEAPNPGEFGLLVTGRDITAQQLVNALEQEGCRAESFGTARNSVWSMYIPGAPLFVNANFPAELPQYTPFFVRCASPPPEFSYECGGAQFIIDGWDNIPLQLTESTNAYFSPQPEVKIRYRIPENAEQVHVAVGLETSVGRIPPGTFPDFEHNKKGILYTHIAGSAWPRSPFIGRIGMTGDGEWHSETVYFSLETESDYNKGQPHRTLPLGQGYSDYSPPPFRLMEPPVIFGTFWVGGTLYLIDTYNADVCTTASVGK